MLIKKIEKKRAPRGLFRCDRVECGKEWEERLSQVKGKMQFCSYECRGIAQREGGIAFQSQKHPSNYADYVCPTCDHAFNANIRKDRNSKNRFCSPECAHAAKKEGGLILEAARETNMERYGVDNVMKCEKIQKIVEEKMMEKYGVPNAFQAEECKRACRETMFDRYGYEHALQVPKFLQQLKDTSMERYGVEWPGASEQALKAQRETNMERYGYEYTLLVPEIKARIDESIFKRWGVKHILQSKELRATFDTHDIFLKGYETKKRNGTLYSSKIEIVFGECLKLIFCDDDVVHHQICNGWEIDFYVNSINTYIQFDGVYWHGLDRPLEVIKEGNGKFDKAIYGTYLRDTRQNEWFLKNSMKLVRVTDIEFGSWKKLGIELTEIRKRLNDGQSNQE